MSEILAKYLIDINKNLESIADKVTPSESGNSSGSATVTVDTAISADSENPVQNKAISEALAKKQDKLTAGTNITITSDGTISAATASGGGSSVTVDTALSTTSTNPVQNKAITNKVNTLTSDIAKKARIATFTNSATTQTSTGVSVSIAYSTFTKAELENAILLVYGYNTYSSGTAPFMCVLPPVTLDSCTYAASGPYNLKTTYRFNTTGSGADSHTMTRAIDSSNITLTPSGSSGSYYIYAVTAIGL